MVTRLGKMFFKFNQRNLNISSPVTPKRPSSSKLFWAFSAASFLEKLPYSLNFPLPCKILFTKLIVRKSLRRAGEVSLINRAFEINRVQSHKRGDAQNRLSFNRLFIGDCFVTVIWLSISPCFASEDSRTILYQQKVSFLISCSTKLDVHLTLQQNV